MPALAEGVDDDEDEDEEMLKLKLARIEARLKLKQLQKAKQRKEGDIAKDVGQHSRTLDGDSGVTSSRATTRPHVRLEPQASRVQVPVSPQKARGPPLEPISPARRKLGMDSNFKAANVSLKRARDGTRLAASNDNFKPMVHESEQSKKPSFSERLAQRNETSHEQQARQGRIAQSRSQGFGTDKTNRPGHLPSESLREQPEPSQPGSQLSLLRRQRSPSKTESTRKPRAATPPLRAQRSQYGEGFGHNTTAVAPHAKARPSRNGEDDSLQKEKNETNPAGFDPFSQIHLKKRHHSHIDVAREMAGKEVYTIPRLFKEVVSPHYDSPDCESDFVVFAILASKSNPYDAKSSHRTSDQDKPQEDADAVRNKFMVLHLTDLKWELDCFLFGTGFDQFWKLTPGTLLAILNPSILPPKGNKHNGRFSLKLGSCEDKVMEIGIARDLGYCGSIKKDGQPCGDCIDIRKTDICEFHLNLMVSKNRKHRMEVNSMWRGHSDDESRPGRKSKNVEKSNGKNRKQAGQVHGEYGRLYSVAFGSSKSAASLLDAEDTDALHNMSREEASRKRIANAQKERDLAKKLGEIGKGPGAEYLRARHNDVQAAGDPHDETSSTAAALFDKPSVSELGLLANRASEQHLSPAKDRKRHFGTGVVSSTGTTALGWGGARKVGFPQLDMKKSGNGSHNIVGPDKGILAGDAIRSGSVSPRKRARFALEQGIREPGRDSLGGDLNDAKARHDNDGDDDDLDII